MKTIFFLLIPIATQIVYILSIETHERLKQYTLGSPLFGIHNPETRIKRNPIQWVKKGTFEYVVRVAYKMDKKDNTQITICPQCLGTVINPKIAISTAWCVDYTRVVQTDNCFIQFYIMYNKHTSLETTIECPQ